MCIDCCGYREWPLSYISRYTMDRNDPLFYGMTPCEGLEFGCDESRRGLVAECIAKGASPTMANFSSVITNYNYKILKQLLAQCPIDDWDDDIMYCAGLFPEKDISALGTEIFRRVRRVFALLASDNFDTVSSSYADAVRKGHVNRITAIEKAVPPHKISVLRKTSRSLYA